MAERANALNDDLFNRASRVIRYVERMMGRGQVFESQYAPPLATFRNDTGETIPAYGLFWVEDDPEISQDHPIIVAKKPDTTFAAVLYVNGDSEVEDDGYGQYQIDSEVKLAYDTGTPVIGDGYGPKPSQFTASKFYPCHFICRGIFDATDKIMLARNLFAIQSLIGKPNANIAKGASGTFNIYSGTAGSEAIITSMTVTVFAKGQALTSTKWATAGFLNGQWYAAPYEC